MLLLHYDFKRQEDRDAWVAHFTNLGNDDGIQLTHKCCGGSVRLLQLKEPEDPEKRNPENATKVSIYEEWESKEALQACFMQRLKAGFMAKWFGFDPETGKWDKMKNDRMDDSHQNLLVKAHPVRGRMLAAESGGGTGDGGDAGAGGVLPPASETSRHITVIHYDFKEQEDCDRWYDHFVDDSNADGFRYTAGFEGSRVCQLLKSTEKGTQASFYEEWDSAGDQMKYGMERAKSGFMEQWFDLDMKTFEWRKLKGEKARVMHMEVIAALG